MKVLMTADAVGGVWTYALDLCAALREHEVGVVLATMGPRPSDQQRMAARSLDNVQLFESEFRLEWMDDPWRDVANAGDWLLGLASAQAVDLVHLNGYSHAALPWRRPVVCVAHSCVATWWQAVHRESAPGQWDEYRRHVTRGLNAADCIVAPTAAFLDQLRACYELRRPTRVIHNARRRSTRAREHSRRVIDTLHDGEQGTVGAHSTEFRTLREDALRSPAIVPVEGAPVVLACGRPWDASKNMRALDEAATGAAWASYAIGGVQGPDGQSFAPASLRCLGTLPAGEVEAWLSRANIFVHPALYEPFGLAVLEAALADCALVLTDIPTLRELWDGAAEFFDPRDSRQLRDVLDRLVANPERQRSLAAAARERANRFRIETTAAEYAVLYRKLVATDKRAVA